MPRTTYPDGVAPLTFEDVAENKSPKLTDKELRAVIDPAAVPVVSEVDKALAYTSLSHFTRVMWPVLEGRKVYKGGWHIEAICDHLEAVSAGQIDRLRIHMPPRHMKSTLVSVMWPVWDWLKTPGRQWLSLSHVHTLSTRDNLKSRRVFQSALYQELLNLSDDQIVRDLRLLGDQNLKTKFENTANGYRMSAGILGSYIGEGGDILTIDDPLDPRGVVSDKRREDINETFDQSVKTRLNDPDAGGIVLTCQRLHHQDLPGHIEERESGRWNVLVLPARYEPGRKCIISTLGFEDPRKDPGEPLHVSRYNSESLDEMEGDLGQYGWAGQGMQRPQPMGGGLFKVGKIALLEEDQFNRDWIEKSVRFWDRAGTEGGSGARTAGVLIHKMARGRHSYIVEDSVTGRWETEEREEKMLETALKDASIYGTFNVIIGLEREPGSAGKDVAAASIRKLAGFLVEDVNPCTEGNKEVRARPFAQQVNVGNVAAVIGPSEGRWLRAKGKARIKEPGLLDELENFPVTALKDQVDAVSSGFNLLHEGTSEWGTW